MPRYVDIDTIPFITVPIAPVKKGDAVVYRDVAFKEEVDKLPTADLLKVRHAEWESFFLPTGYKAMKCSLCENAFVVAKDYINNYCPSRGAKMDLEKIVQ